MLWKNVIVECLIMRLIIVMFLFSANTLYWLDAKAEIIGRINLDTGEKKIIYSEPRAHFFGMALLGQYLYVTDWFRK